MPAKADPSRLTRTKHQIQFGFVTSGFELLPAKRQLKKPPQDVQIFEYDSSALDKRAPFLFVHGLRGEFLPTFRWEKVAQRFNSDPKFRQKYKIYLARYSTLTSLDKSVPGFQQAITRLYSACDNQPITIMALSMGGNLVYESMLDEDTDSKVRAVISLGTPFHGSPLFSKDWLQYSLYKRLCLPLTRVDHSMALKLYFDRNKNLQTDLSWDNADKAVPNVGKFKSKLLFGPKGNLTHEDDVNYRLHRINERGATIKRKFITYSGYLENPYIKPKSVRYIEKTLFYPVTLFWVKYPAHLAREHAVLNLLNHDIACVTVNEEWQKKMPDSPFLYALNDGITPVASALFLPENVLTSTPLNSVQSIAKLKEKTDVNFARVFRNIDHLTFIDGTRHLRNSTTRIKDELNPSQPERDMVAWMLGDIMSLDNKKIAGESEKPTEAADDTINGAHVEIKTEAENGSPDEKKPSSDKTPPVEKKEVAPDLSQNESRAPLAVEMSREAVGAK